MYTKTGFTLIELLVVVLIIGILTSIAVPQYQKAVERSKAVQALTWLKAWRNATVQYHLANGSYPQTFDVLSLGTAWTGTEKGCTWGSAYIKDTRSNNDWSFQLYDAEDGHALYMTRLTGKYKGSGFRIDMSSDSSGKIVCMERYSHGIIFGLAEGSYCEQIMDGTRVSWDRDNSYTFRAYSLP